MIIKVKKVLFIGVKEDQDRFFKCAQEKGFIEFLSKQAQCPDYPEHLHNIIIAIKLLSKQPVQHLTETPQNFDIQKLANTIVENKSQLDKLLEERKMLINEIARIEPLGDFSLSDIRYIEQQSHRHIQFFCAEHKKPPFPKELIHLHAKHKIDYFMSISTKVRNFSGMAEIHLEKSLQERKQELQQVTQSIHRCEEILQESGKYLDLLKDFLAMQLNQHNLISANKKTSTHLNDTLFAVEGWIPKNRIQELFPLLAEMGVHAEEIAIEKEARIPTYMENKNYGKMGEDLVHIYDTPAIDDKDPSIWVFWAFALFFAMIVSDAGYGAIFLALSLFLQKKFSHVHSSVKRLFRLFTVLSCSCIVWGILSNSYFGINIAPNNSLNKISLIHHLSVKKADYHILHQDTTYAETIAKYPLLKEIREGKVFLQQAVDKRGGFTRYVILNEFRDSVLMEIALLVGVIHISLSLLRYWRRHWGGIGWIIAIIGGYLFFPKFLHSTSILHFTNCISKQMGYVIGLYLLIGGMTLALLLALIQHRWSGFIEVTKLIELFADILSYLRIYALGLASMILADTFNSMGASLGLFIGFFIILLGHVINIVVGIMGGTIHGLRLNFIEWYHHSFTGGGKLFQPLKLLKTRNH